MVYNSKKLADDILTKTKKEVTGLDKKPTLAVVSFGTNHSVYIKKKEEAANFVGINFKKYSFDENLSARTLRQKLHHLAKSPTVDSIVVQLPLPKKIGSSILNIIPPEKDPDLLSERSLGRFFSGRQSLEPPTAGAIVKILGEQKINLNGARVAIFGYGRLVGRFLAKMLLDRKATVSIADHPMSAEQTKKFVSGANIIVSAVGSTQFLESSLLPKNSIVIDAGFSTLDGKVYGDVVFSATQKEDRFRLVVSTSGGIGPVSVALLLKNVIQLYK